MPSRKIPMRMCVVTHEKYPKNELVRVVNTVDGVLVDPTGKINGHGAYLKKDKNVFKKAKDKKILEKALGVEVKDDVFEQLDKLL